MRTLNDVVDPLRRRTPPSGSGGHKRLQCRCGRGDAVRIPDGQSPTVMDIRFHITRIDLAGFPVGWRLYAWVSRGAVVHLESVCPDCPRPQRKSGGDDPDAVEVARA